MKFKNFKNLDLPPSQQAKIKGGNDGTTVPPNPTTDYIGTQDVVDG